MQKAREQMDHPSHETSQSKSVSSRPSQSRRAPHLSTRRTILIAGLVAGATILAGGEIVTRQFLRSHYPTLEVQLDPGSNAFSAAPAWSPDGSSIATLFSATRGSATTKSEQGVEVIDVNSGQKTWTHLSPRFSFDALAWSPNGTWFATTGHTAYNFQTPVAQQPDKTLIQLWQVHGWRQVAQYSPPHIPSQNNSTQTKPTVKQMVWSPDSTRLAVVLSDVFGEEATWLYICNANDGRVLFTRQAPPDAVLMPLVCWLPGGTLLATSWLQGELDIWNIHTGTNVFHHEADHLPASGATSSTMPRLLSGPGAAMSPDGKRAAICVLEPLEQKQMIIQIWDVHTSRLLFRCQSTGEAAGFLGNLTWSPDGKYIAAFGQYQLYLWDAGSGVQSFTYQTLCYPDELTWSPDGRFLAMTDYRNGPFFIKRYFDDKVLRVFAVG